MSGPANAEISDRTSVVEMGEMRFFPKLQDLIREGALLITQRRVDGKVDLQLQAETQETIDSFHSRVAGIEEQFRAQVKDRLEGDPVPESSLMMIIGFMIGALDKKPESPMNLMLINPYLPDSTLAGGILDTLIHLVSTKRPNHQGGAVLIGYNSRALIGPDEPAGDVTIQ